MSTFSDELKKLGACEELLEWIGDRTLSQVWETFAEPAWAWWMLEKKAGAPGWPSAEDFVAAAHAAAASTEAAAQAASNNARRKRGNTYAGAAAKAAVIDCCCASAAVSSHAVFADSAFASSHVGAVVAYAEAAAYAAAATAAPYFDHCKFLRQHLTPEAAR